MAKHDEWMEQISRFLGEHDLKKVKVKLKNTAGEKHELRLPEEPEPAMEEEQTAEE